MMEKLLSFCKALINSFQKYDKTYKNLTDSTNSGSTKYDLNKEMQLDLYRFWHTDKSTIGKLHIDGQFECYTLEDVVRNEKVYGETAIPAGRYEVVINYSPKFKTSLPYLKQVPFFKGIRIHPGNTAKDTEGCILVGETKEVDFIGRSRRAFNKLLKRLKEAKKEKKKISIIIHY